jgi:predicted kinase
MEKVLVIIRGIPGSGKTSFAKLISKAICSADDYYMDRNGNYNWSPDTIVKAHKWCQKKCDMFLKKGITPVIVANTSTTKKELKPYYAIAEKYGYKVFSVIVENRHDGKNIHGVPEETIKRMTDKFDIKL